MVIYIFIFEAIQCSGWISLARSELPLKNLWFHWFSSLLENCRPRIQHNRCFESAFFKKLSSLVIIAIFESYISTQGQKSWIWYSFFRAVASSIIGGGGLIFIYLRSAQLISFEIDCFYGVWTRIYEYQPPPPELATALFFFQSTFSLLFGVLWKYFEDLKHASHWLHTGD